MKKYPIIMSLLLLACNSKEDQLQKQLLELEAQLPAAEQQYQASIQKIDSVKQAITDASFMDSEAYKNAVSSATDAKIKTDSLKKAIADTKEKILLQK